MEIGGSPEIYVMLLSRGADMNLKNKLGLTARQEVLLLIC
jgi:hypothetical protein